MRRIERRRSSSDDDLSGRCSLKNYVLKEVGNFWWVCHLIKFKGG